MSAYFVKTPSLKISGSPGPLAQIFDAPIRNIGILKKLTFQPVTGFTVKTSAWKLYRHNGSCGSSLRNG